MNRLRENMRQAYEKAMEHAATRESQNKRNFDSRVKIQDLQPGDHVLLKNLGVPGKHKPADWWRPQPYNVYKQLPGLPVYQIRPDGEKVRCGTGITCYHYRKQ